MITTIQLNETVKNRLSQLKENPGQSYENIIVKMLQLVEKQKRQQEEFLIEGYKEMAEESLKICKEWSAADNELNWEY